MPAKKRGTKRAASSSVSASDHRAKKAPSESASDHRPKKASVLTASGLRNIVAGLDGAGELSKDTLSEFASLIGWHFGVQCFDVAAKDSSVKRLSEALHEVEEKLVHAVGVLQAKAEIAGLENRDLESTTAIAQAKVTASKQAWAENKLTLKAIMKEMDSARHEIHAAEKARKYSASQLQAHAKRTECLHTAQSTVEPLKAVAAKGSDGQKRLRALKKVGADFGIHSVLLDTMPAVLKKPPERRESFDNIAISQLEVQFNKQNTALEVERDTLMAKLEACSIRVKVAYDAILSVQERKSVVMQLIDDANKSVEASKAELALTQQRAKAFQVVVEEESVQLESLKSRLNAFRRGVVVAFKELQEATVPMAEAHSISEGVANGCDMVVAPEALAQAKGKACKIHDDKLSAQERIAEHSHEEGTVQTMTVLPSDNEPSPQEVTGTPGVVGWFKRLMRSNSNRDGTEETVANASERHPSVHAEAAPNMSEAETVAADVPAVDRSKLLNALEASASQELPDGDECPVPKGMPASLSPC